MPTQVTPEHNERIAKLTFAGVYPHYVTKVEKKGRSVEELHTVIEWLTGFDEAKLQQLIDRTINKRQHPLFTIFACAYMSQPFFKVNVRPFQV